MLVILGEIWITKCWTAVLHTTTIVMADYVGVVCCQSTALCWQRNRAAPKLLVGYSKRRGWTLMQKIEDLTALSLARKSNRHDYRMALIVRALSQSTLFYRLASANGEIETVRGNRNCS